MEKRVLEIALSSGLVFMLIILLLAVQLAVPPAMVSTGFVLAILFFIILMGAAGVKLMDMR